MVTSPAAALRVYVINLDRAPERWAMIQDHYGALPYPVDRIAALDASADPGAVLAERGQTLVRPPAGLGWNPLRSRMFSLVEEACFSSHLRALRRFLADGAAHAVILEDDAVPRRDVASELEEIVASGVAFDVVKLEGIKRRGRRLAILERRLSSAALVRSFAPSPGSAAYLVTRAGARRLVDCAGATRVPFDDYLCNPGWHGCRVLDVSPWLVWQADVGSMMQDQRRSTRGVRQAKLRQQLLRSARRLRLRLALWRAAAFGFPGAPFPLVPARW